MIFFVHRAMDLLYWCYPKCRLPSRYLVHVSLLLESFRSAFIGPYSVTHALLTQVIKPYLFEEIKCSILKLIQWIFQSRVRASVFATHVVATQSHYFSPREHACLAPREITHSLFLSDPGPGEVGIPAETCFLDLSGNDPCFQYFLILLYGMVFWIHPLSAGFYAFLILLSLTLCLHSPPDLHT